MALLIVLGCLIGLCIIIGAGYGARVRSEIRRLSPVPTGLIVDGIYAIRDGHVNMYLIRRNGTYVAVDAGRSVQKLGVRISHPAKSARMPRCKQVAAYREK